MLEFLAGLWRSFAGGKHHPSATLSDVLRRFAELSETDLPLIERALRGHTAGQPDQNLLYALRISLVVRRVTKLETLASRWNAANSGAGGSGLSLAKDAALYPPVAQFLASYYLQRLEILLAARIDKNLATVSARKSAPARAAAAAKAAAELEALRHEFLHPLPGAEESIARARVRLNQPSSP